MGCNIAYMKRFLLLFIITSFAFATTINVPADYPTIQAGLDAANERDTVLVFSGTYVENITWPETYEIKLIGSGENQCIIDGDSLDSVIRFEWGLNEGTIDENTLITGFTIQNGNAHVDEYPYYHGGGIFFANGCSATLTNLNISNN